MKKIVVAGKYNPEAVTLFTEQLPEGFELSFVGMPSEHSVLVDAVAEADYLIVRGRVPVDDAVLQKAKKLRLIQKWGAGYDQYDMASIGSYRIPFLNCAGINAVQVSEMALALTLSLYRYLNVAANKYKEGLALKEEYLPLCHTIDGKTVGIVGIGNIGKRVAHLMQGFGAQVQYYDAFRLTPEVEKALDLRYADLETLFKTSDIVSLHVPLLPETTHLVNKNTLKLMKPDAIIVNTSRGKVICESDLYEALINKTIAGAALDVLESEDPANVVNNPLMQLENVVVTPHMGASTKEVTQLQVSRCFGNILKVDRGELKDPKSFLNGEFFA